MHAGPADEEEFEALPVVPLGDKKLRACLVTGLVKTEDQVRANMPICHINDTHAQPWVHPLRCMCASQFYREGNDNVPCLRMDGDREMVYECTSANFDGCDTSMTHAFFALPRAMLTYGWLRAVQIDSDDEAGRKLGGAVARNLCVRQLSLRLYVQLYSNLHLPSRSLSANFVPGCYALRVKGTLRSEHIVTLEENGIRYRPLDDDDAS